VSTPQLPVGFALPAGFDSVTYATLHQRFASFATGPQAQVWRVFAAAWNGIAYRLRSADEQRRILGASLRRSAAPPPDERYTQEQALFVFFGSAASALECFYLASYCAANLLDPTTFPIDKAGHLNKYAPEIAKEFVHLRGTEAISVALSAHVASAWWTQLFDLRNVLTHRGSLPRLHFVSNVPGHDRPSAVPRNPKALSGAWQYEFAMTDVAIDSLYTEVEGALNALLRALLAFHDRQLRAERSAG
jgi:hypothetical protein